MRFAAELEALGGHAHPRHSRMQLRLSAGLLVLLAGCGRTVLRPVPCVEPEPPLPRSGFGWQASSEPGVVRGWVRAVSDSDVSVVLVGLRPAGRDTVWREGPAAPTGAFRFDSVAPGAYVVEVRRIGYRRVRDTVRVTADSGVLVAAVLSRDEAVLDGCGYANVETRLPWWRFW